MLAAMPQKPLAVLGGSGWTDGGPRAASANFLIANNLPVAVCFRRQGCSTAPCPISSATSASAPIRRWWRAPRRPTSLLAIGTRLGEAVTQGYTLFDPAGGAPIVHVYPDPAEIGRVFRPALGIAADLNAFARLRRR